MTLTQQLIMIALMTCTTLLTRYLPFVIFRSDKPIPPVIQYFGSILPPAIFGLLVIYALRDIRWSSYAHSLPAIGAIIAIVLVHLWKRNMLISIAVGTIIYMLLIRI
ncbi:branched-chain amino acid transporter permease [Macrococcus brunensis]|uniref:branched-chain amino acid transporter permease n=1 Tax=Macrococcus brunensis TaxID=198483 RepID=UPI001EEFA209|nr:AzlD domain-containing protein [Macrococcus brunensis]ULG72265.1 AzlD domain-containing protein [Macrococcus brunensis]